MTSAAKALWQRYYGQWPKSQRYAPSGVTARPKELMGFVVVTVEGPGGVLSSGGYRCGPLPASGGHKRRTY